MCDVTEALKLLHIVYSAFVAAWMLVVVALVIALIISSHMSRFVTSNFAIYDIIEAL